MISFSFELRNPFGTRWANIFNRGKVFNTKSVEFEIYRDTTIISFSFNWTTRQDHAGVNLELGLLGYTMSLQCYDTRHWNKEAGRFYNYDSAGNAT